MTINCKGELIDLSSPKVMGILNVTPDSFYDGGRYKKESDILYQTEKMLSEGATFIDIGAYSSRPGADHVSLDEELKRIVPVVRLLINEFPNIRISIDTFRSEVVKATIAEGASIINDISGGNMDDRMFATIAELQIPYIMMHMQGTPQNMQQNPSYENVINEVYYFFTEQLRQLNDLKVNDVILDIGFGFGKTIEHNYELLHHLNFFQNLGVPILTGVSRKSMLYKVLDLTAKEALNATTVANTIALLNGSNILRVHDVKEAMEAIHIVSKLPR